MLKAAHQADIVIGSRKLPTSTITVRQPLHRRLVSRAGDLIRKTFFLSDIYDTQCGFKLFNRAVVLPILELARIDRYAFDIELLVIARELGLTIREVPVEWHHDERGTFNVWKAAREVLLNLFRIKLYQWRGFYKHRI